jgi:hypothetical protein
MGRSLAREEAYRSLHMQITGRKSGRRVSFLSFDLPGLISFNDLATNAEAMKLRRTLLWLAKGQGDEFVDKSRVLQNLFSTRITAINRDLTLSLPPVAPSISSIITSTGFEPPTDEPASNTGRIRSSMVLPERASLKWEIKE